LPVKGPIIVSLGCGLLGGLETVEGVLPESPSRSTGQDRRSEYEGPCLDVCSQAGYNRNGRQDGWLWNSGPGLATGDWRCARSLLPLGLRSIDRVRSFVGSIVGIHVCDPFGREREVWFGPVAQSKGLGIESLWFEERSGSRGLLP